MMALYLLLFAVYSYCMSHVHWKLGRWAKGE